jgi:protein tyrosine phosphatase (PTP) superfamily phosphohydrolase (DUF442 family)
MGSNGLKFGLAALVTATAIGCGSVTPAGRPMATAPASQTAAAESTPSDAELQQLAAESPDHLIPNAPPEPGMKASHLWPSPPPGDLANFGKVEDNLWRGARPTDAGLQKLADMGVKTIVNFENDETAVNHEQSWAVAHGIKFVTVPLSVITPPSMDHINQWIGTAEDPTNRPLYFHCMQGRDRTGVACFTYRVHHDHWKYDQAYQEMLQYHFHTYLLGLRAFLVWYADTQGKQPAPATF